MTKYLLAKFLLLGCTPMCFAPDSIEVREVSHVQVEQTQQQAYMIWEHECIDEVKMTSDAYLIAPMKDGVPDTKRARFLGLSVKYHDCPKMHMDIRREPKP